MEAQVDEKVREWLRLDRDEETRSEILRLKESRDRWTLEDRLCNGGYYSTVQLAVYIPYLEKQAP